MREHLPSLITRASGLVRDIGPLLRHFAHSVGVGLVSLGRRPRISSSARREKRSTTMRDRSRNAHGSPSQAERNLRERGDSRQLSASSGSAIPTETGDRSKNKNLIISIHIAKTGGTTFVDILRKCADEVLYLDYDYDYQPSPTALYRRGKRIKPPFESIIDDLGLLPGRSVIHGHFQAIKYTDRFPKAVYVTWLRDPVERIISHYLYWQRSHIPGDTKWEQVTGQQMDLEQFAQLDFVRDLQRKYLVPLAVEEFGFIGITEEYDRSLELFRRLFCPEMQFDATVRNENPHRQGKFYDLDPELRKKILQCNEGDASIYLDGVRRFHHLCEQMGI